MSKKLKTNVLGYPRIGKNRELKKALESYWAGNLSFEDLQSTGAELRRQNWLRQQEAGIDLIPSNDFSFYDQVLDLSCTVGNIPSRFEAERARSDIQFLIARGITSGPCGCGESAGDGQPASDMTKWFDTNYHYIVPEFSPGTSFSLADNKPLREFREALELGIKTKPVLIGPFTYLHLGRNAPGVPATFDRWELLERLIPVYLEILKSLAEAGAEWIQLDEPIFALDQVPAVKFAAHQVYKRLKVAAGDAGIVMANYFGGLSENLDLFCDLPVDALHIDAHRAPEEVEAVAQRLGSTRKLSLGVISGREIWKVNHPRAGDIISKTLGLIGPERLILASSCSLLHVPYTLEGETELPAELLQKLAFASEKLDELVVLAGREYQGKDAQNRAVSQAASLEESLDPASFHRLSDYPQRKVAQQRLNLPLFPTTTIGSFPQTKEVRQARSRFRKGDSSLAEYEAEMKAEIERTIREQEKLGLDVLVHGEAERNDMVEYFGELLEGYAFTRNGWVQSYGSRCVKPPVIWADIARPQPMTVAWASYAQSLTSIPVKGMLTGPVTMLQWSFVRDDLPRREVAYQLALAIRKEVKDLEAAGIAVIQINETPIRFLGGQAETGEKLPGDGFRSLVVPADHSGSATPRSRAN